MAANFFLDRKGRTDEQITDALHDQIEFRVLRRKPPSYAPDRVYVEAVLRNPFSRRSLIRKDPYGARQPTPRPPSRPSPTQGAPASRCDSPCCRAGGTEPR